MAARRRHQLRGRGGRTAVARGARHRRQQDRHPSGALAGPDRQVRRRVGRLRRHRSDRPVPDVHVPAVAGRRQADVQLHLRAGRVDVGVHVRPALGHDRLARGDADVHVLCARLFLHPCRAGRVARRLRQPEKHIRRRRRSGRRLVEQFERSPDIRCHVRQLRSEVSDGVSVRHHLWSIHPVHIVLDN